MRLRSRSIKAKRQCFWPDVVDGEILIVIEAPGKLATMGCLLRSIGLADRVVVFATKGHLSGMPQNLIPLGITPDGRETLRSPINAHLVAELQEAAAGRHVLLLTDPDQEGDVIAVDAAVMLEKIAASVGRARMASLTVDGLKEALSSVAPCRPMDAVPGRARAVVDRLIGAILSKDGIAAGRVSTALLGAVIDHHREGTLCSGEVSLAVRAADGGPPFTMVMPVSSQSMAEHLIEECEKVQPVQALRGRLPTPSPWTMGVALMAGATQLDVPLQDVESALQEAYEKGELSYPRTAAPGIAHEHLVATRTSAARLSLPFNAACLPDKGKDAPHEGLHILTEIDLMADPRLLPGSLAMMVLIGRGTVLAGQVAMGGIPVNLPPHLAGLQASDGIGFHRRDKRLPWEKAPSLVMAYRPWAPDVAALAVLLDHKLGRPSTMVGHAVKFVRRELLGKDCKPTEKAYRWFGKSLPELLRPQTSNSMESIFESLPVKWRDIFFEIGGGQWEEMFSMAIADCVIAAMTEAGIGKAVAMEWNTMLCDEASNPRGATNDVGYNVKEPERNHYRRGQPERERGFAAFGLIDNEVDGVSCALPR